MDNLGVLRATLAAYTGDLDFIDQQIARIRHILLELVTEAGQSFSLTNAPASAGVAKLVEASRHLNILRAHLESTKVALIGYISSLSGGR